MTVSRRRAEQRMERAITVWSTQKIYPGSQKETVIDGRPRKPRRPRSGLSMSCGTDMDLLRLSISLQAYSRIRTLKPSYSSDFSKPHRLLLSLFPAHLHGVTSSRYEYFRRAESEAPGIPPKPVPRILNSTSTIRFPLARQLSLQ